MTHILDEQIHDTAILDVQAHAARTEHHPLAIFCACGVPACKRVHIQGSFEDLCMVCFNGHYQNNDRLATPWEAEDLPLGLVTCPNCGAAHGIQACPEIKAALTDGYDAAHDLIAELRTQLATAHEALGQSIAAMQAATDAMHKLAFRLADKGLYGYECDLAGDENPAAFQGLTAAIETARKALL